MENDPQYNNLDFVQFVQRILFYADNGVQVRTIQKKFPHMSYISLRYILRVHGIREKFGEEYMPYDTHFALLSRKEIDDLGIAVFRAVNRPTTYAEHLAKKNIRLKDYLVSDGKDWMKKILPEPKKGNKRLKNL